MKKTNSEPPPAGTSIGDGRLESKMSFAEYQGQAAHSPVLLAGVAYAVKQDGGPRKRTVTEWNQAVEAFASAPTH